MYDHTNDVPLASDDHVNRSDATRPTHSSDLLAGLTADPVVPAGRPSLEDMRTPPVLIARARAILGQARAAVDRGEVPWDDTPSPVSEPSDDWLSPSECRIRADREHTKRMGA